MSTCCSRGSTLAVIPRAGHLAPAENPVEFNRVVREFLRGLPG